MPCLRAGTSTVMVPMLLLSDSITTLSVTASPLRATACTFASKAAPVGWVMEQSSSTRFWRSLTEPKLPVASTYALRKVSISPLLPSTPATPYFPSAYSLTSSTVSEDFTYIPQFSLLFNLKVPEQSGESTPVVRLSLKSVSLVYVFYSGLFAKLCNISKFQTFMSKKFTLIFDYDDFLQHNLVISQSTRHHYLCLLASKHQVFAKQTDRARWCVGSPTRSPTFFSLLLSETR